jgi:predicted nuclease of restriction endonuclease-like RecB superfamily
MSPSFKGTFEPKVHTNLEGLAQKYGYSLQYEPLTFKIKIEQDYTPDFMMIKGDKELFIETKGYFRYEDQQKAKAFRRDYPHADYYILFQKDNPIRKGAKLTYTGWCAKNGITAFVGETIPEGWLA